MNPGNLDAIGEFLDPNSFLIGFMRKFVTERVTGMPDAQTKVEELFGEDDKVTVCATMTGTNSGAMLGHPPTNKSVAINSIWVFTIKNGKIISLRFASDMAQQLWMSPSS